jgi:hypothetical protein
MGADDVEGKSAQRNDDEYRDQKGHRDPHQDAACEVSFPAAALIVVVAIAATQHQHQRSSSSAFIPNDCISARSGGQSVSG